VPAAISLGLRYDELPLQAASEVLDIAGNCELKIVDCVPCAPEIERLR